MLLLLRFTGCRVCILLSTLFPWKELTFLSPLRPPLFQTRRAANGRAEILDKTSRSRCGVAREQYLEGRGDQGTGEERSREEGGEERVE